MELLSEAEMRASLAAMLAAAEAPRETWVFAYGSLIWNPAFHFVEQRVGRVHGFHRRFCLWTHLGRGSPSTPGLMLALEPGGSCRASPIASPPTPAVRARDHLAARDARRAYRPRWVPVRTDAGVVRALAFTITAPMSATPAACPRMSSRRPSRRRPANSVHARNICSTRSPISRRSASTTGR